MTDEQTAYLDARTVYQGIVELAHTTGGSTPALLRGLGAAAGTDAVVAVAELEAGLALLLLRHRSGLSFTLDQGLRDLFADVGAGELDEPTRAALLQRVVATAGGLWSDPEGPIAAVDLEVLARAYLALLLDVLAALGEYEDDALAAYRAYSDYQVHGAG